MPGNSYHSCSSNALHPCTSGSFWDQAAAYCEVAMCPLGALLGPSTNGPNYANPNYYSDNPSCPCYCPPGIYWNGIRCFTSPTQCAIGYYINGSGGTCTQCPSGKTTLTAGASSVAQCGKTLLSLLLSIITTISTIATIATIITIITIPIPTSSLC